MKFLRKGSLGHPNVWSSFKMPRKGHLDVWSSFKMLRKVHPKHQITLIHVFNFQDMTLSNAENKEQGS
jgi:hypothetical protein